jgi:NTE family protein
VTPLFGKKPRRLGLALSGGGSRGLAHVGVLRALGERRIRPNCVAGTSAGAIVGALYGAGYSSEAMIEFFREKSPFRLSKVSLTKPGILDMDKVVADFEEYFPDDSFEVLDPRLSVVATDILRGERVVFDAGRLIPAVLASSAVPVVFAPVEIDGEWFADGGIVDNFPVGEVAGSCDVILGVYVNPRHRLEEPELTSSLAVLQRAVEIGSYSLSSRSFGNCDFLICPESLARYGTFGMKHLEEIEAIGYEAAIEQIDAIAAALRVA